jgi:sialate O-acetylesterase
VFAAEIPNPQSVRYAWDYNPSANLINAAGLPAPLFRTNENDER